MRIGIDGSCLANRRGFGRFARQLLRALAGAESPHEFVVFVDRPSADAVEVPSRFATSVVNVREAPSKAASSAGRRAFGDMLAMGRAVARAKPDLIYFPASYSFFPVWGVRRVVVTMHDTLAMTHPSLVFPGGKGRVAWSLKEYAAARVADKILTVSESARRDLIAWFRLPPDRVGVLTEGPESVFGPRPEGADSDAALGRYGLRPGSRYLLYVGGLSPHKNLPRLIRAFGATGLAREGVQLVLVGDTGDVFHTHVPALRAEVEGAGLVGSVVFTGFVPDDDLVYLYNRAEALAQPSLMEGFGLPPVEAMACGTPVVSSRAGSLPEVVDDAGVFFDPLDVAGMAAAVRTVFDDPGRRADLSARATRRASRFTWAEAASRLLACFDALGPSASDSPRKESA